MKRKSVTMDDVAERAQVSRQTVSRVLHSNDYVSEKTWEKVEKAIMDVGAESEARQQGSNVFICGSEAGELGEPPGSPLLNSQRAEGVLILYRGSSRDHHRLLGVCRP